MPFNISKVEVQGAKDAKEWPYKFCLSYSLNQSQFTEVKTQETSCLVSHHDISFIFFFLTDRTSSYYRNRPHVLSKISVTKDRV